MVHDSSHLRYQLVQGRVCLEPLRILATREIQWNDWRVRFHVLGASHAIVLEKGDVCLTELFTCAPVSNSKSVLAQTKGALPVQLCPDVPGFQCRIVLEPFALTEGDALHLDTPETDTLTVLFPHSAGMPAPITRIGWRTEGDVLRIETIHTYPEEQSGIRSQTVLRSLAGTTTTQRSRNHAV